MIKEEAHSHVSLAHIFVLSNHPFQTLIFLVIVFKLLMSINGLFYHSYRMVVIIHSAQVP